MMTSTGTSCHTLVSFQSSVTTVRREIDQVSLGKERHVGIRRDWEAFLGQEWKEVQCHEIVIWMLFFPSSDTSFVKTGHRSFVLSWNQFVRRLACIGWNLSAELCLVGSEPEHSVFEAESRAGSWLVVYRHRTFCCPWCWTISQHNLGELEQVLLCSCIPSSGSLPLHTILQDRSCRQPLLQVCPLHHHRFLEGGVWNKRLLTKAERFLKLGVSRLKLKVTYGDQQLVKHWWLHLLPLRKELLGSHGRKSPSFWCFFLCRWRGLRVIETSVPGILSSE